MLFIDIEPSLMTHNVQFRSFARFRPYKRQESPSVWEALPKAVD